MPVCMLYSVLPPCAPSRAPFQSACRPNASGSRLAALARCGHACRASSGPEQPSGDEVAPSVSDRRGVLLAAAGALSMVAAGPAAAVVEGYTPMTALKGKDYGKARMSYGDYTSTASGLQYFDLREGSGSAPGPGATCTVDWDGYTIGYYGRPFEARNKVKGGSFTGDDKEFLRIKLGTGQVIPAFEEALKTMKVGGVRRIIVPEEIGYPNNDFSRVGPQPTTFSGRRALDFVLKNQGMIDRTLLFDIELKRVD